MNLGHHLHLIGVVHDELLGVSSVSSVGSLASRNNFALRSYSWNFVVVFIWHVGHVLLHGSEHAHIIMLVTHILLILHKIGASCCSQLHLGSHLVVLA